MKNNYAMSKMIIYVSEKKMIWSKKNLSMNYDKLLSLVQQAGAEACDSLQDVKDLMVNVESYFGVFAKFHDSYVEALEEVTLEKDAEAVFKWAIEHTLNMGDTHSLQLVSPICYVSKINKQLCFQVNSITKQQEIIGRCFDLPNDHQVLRQTGRGLLESWCHIFRLGAQR